VGFTGAYSLAAPVVCFEALVPRWWLRNFCYTSGMLLVRIEEPFVMTRKSPLRTPIPGLLLAFLAVFALCGTAAGQEGECRVGTFPDTDCDGTPDYLDLDSDGDGIPDADEWTTPESASALGVAADAASLARRNDFDQDGVWDFRDLDSDDDSVSDAEELAAGTDPNRPARHSADKSDDGHIDLGELLRIIQFYNFGGLECAGETVTEDGFAPATAPQLIACMPHSSDYNPHDWRVSLSELLRQIQLFSFGAYHPCGEGEEGYCPRVAGPKDATALTAIAPSTLPSCSFLSAPIHVREYA